MTIAWVFPGQGSQKLGMADFVLGLEGAQNRFDYASELLGRDLLSICRSNEPSKAIDQLNDINDTRNTQPALFVIESLLVDNLRRQGREASYVAGHSLGEFAALYSADVFDVETALRLLVCRSELMAKAGGGAMSAVIGFDRNQLEELINKTDGVVIANDNSSAQVVISGLPEAVALVSEKLRCKRLIPLSVSGAFHSPFMYDASQVFSAELDKISFNDARIPVLSNSDPVPTTNSEVLKNRLKLQMISGVRWREIMETLVSKEIGTIVEIGPGNVLSGLAKRSMPGVSISQISCSNDLGY